MTGSGKSTCAPGIATVTVRRGEGGREGGREGGKEGGVFVCFFIPFLYFLVYTFYPLFLTISLPPSNPPFLSLVDLSLHKWPLPRDDENECGGEEMAHGAAVEGQGGRR